MFNIISEVIIMKKVIYCILISMLLIAFTGCNDNVADASNEGSESVSNIQQNIESSAVEESAKEDTNICIGQSIFEDAIEPTKEAFERMTAFECVTANTIAETNVITTENDEIVSVQVNGEDYCKINLPVTVTTCGKTYTINNTSDLKKYVKDLVSETFYNKSNEISLCFGGKSPIYQDYKGQLVINDGNGSTYYGNEEMYSEARILDWEYDDNGEYSCFTVALPTKYEDEVIWYILDVVYEDGKYKPDRCFYQLGIE